MMRHFLFFLSIFLLLGCDRPFAEVGEATISVVSPDVTMATAESSIMLELSVESVRDVTRVRSQFGDFAQDAGSSHWISPVSLKKGLNQVIIEAFVDNGPTRVDTLSIFHLTYTLSSAPSSLLSFGTGSHTISHIPGNSVLLVGGSFQAGHEAALDAHTWTEGDHIFKPIRNLPTFPRVGHTATELSNGNVLIVGGAVRGDIDDTSDLVSFVELYDPVKSQFVPVPYSGDPIRRMYHSAILRQVNDKTFLILLGGRGDTRYFPTPQLGIREDMRTFEFRNDSLIALSPAVGPFIEAVAGHIQARLSNDRYLVSGLDFGVVSTPASFIMDFASPFGIEISKTANMNTPRIRSAAVTIAPGIVALFGGRGEVSDDVLATSELFVEDANQYFTLPFEIAPRFGHTATKLSDNSILLLGGFDATSNALTATDFVSLSVQ
jgi:hypothetical protein